MGIFISIHGCMHKIDIFDFLCKKTMVPALDQLLN